jgi:hypothetical protein
VPVIVSGKVPLLALGFAFTVKTVPVVELVWLNEALVLAGNPLNENVTVPLNPFCGFTVMVNVVDPRGEIVRLATFEVSEKSPDRADCTTSVTCVLWTVAPLVPVIVTV